LIYISPPDGALRCSSSLLPINRFGTASLLRRLAVVDVNMVLVKQLITVAAVMVDVVVVYEVLVLERVSELKINNAGQIVESESFRFGLLESLVKIVDGGSLLIALFNPVLFRKWRKLNKMCWP
jgi:hypothetical protein